jgi:hypothetical protein
MNVHLGQALSQRILTVLRAAGLRAGHAVKPTTTPAAGWVGSTFNGYVVLYPMSGGLVDGTIDNPNEDASVLYQITAVGATAEQTELVADRARVAITSGTYPATGGRSVLLVEVDMVGGVSRDDDAQPPVYYQPDRYRFRTAPT